MSAETLGRWEIKSGASYLAVTDLKISCVAVSTYEDRSPSCEYCSNTSETLSGWMAYRTVRLVVTGWVSEVAPSALVTFAVSARMEKIESFSHGGRIVSPSASIPTMAPNRVTTPREPVG